MKKFIAVGGAGEIGANCYYLNIDGTGILLDCGMNPRMAGYDALPNLALLENQPVDYVLISHAHQDHIGSLPYLVKKFPYIKIITTPQTRAIAEITLHNSVEIIKNENNDRINSFFTHDEIDLLIQSIMWKEYETDFTINGYHHSGSDVSAKFYDAGHILGSASILINHDNKRIFFTGDINTDSQSLLRKAKLPPGNVDVLITETTYGSTDSSLLPPLKSEIQRLAKSINNVINRGGSVLIPVFSLGKLQELSAIIAQLISDGRIPDIDVYSGGIGTKISRIYDYNRYVIRSVDPEFVLSDIPQKNLFEVGDPLDFFRHPCIVLATSGMMMPGTLSYKLARHWIKQKNSAVFLVGYMDPQTPGCIFSLSKKGDRINLYGTEEIINCDIIKFRFPSHARREGLLNIAGKLKPEKIILVHGDEESIKWVGSEILKIDKNRKVFAAVSGKHINLD